MAELDNSPDNIIKQIDKSLRTVISQFYYYPRLFFNESGLQHYFYAVFYRNKFFSATNLIRTKDGKRTNLIHPEYGSAKNIPGKWRACYDMVILNPGFISDNDYDRITSKSIGKINEIKTDDLLAIFELKLIQHKTVGYTKQLKKDLESLKYANEAKFKYLIIFDCLEEERWPFIEVNFDDIENLRLVHIKVYFDKRNRKKIKILIKPNNFLNLPQSWIVA